MEHNKNQLAGYRPDIDGLRAIAVLLVLIFHFDLFSVGGGGGFLGVDVFFVISGYLITRIIVKGLENNNFKISTFYIRRIRRLAPALIIVLIGTFIFGCIVLFPQDLKSLSEQILYSQFYLSNIFYWQSINYFGLRADHVFLLHTWSLAVEEQFYIFFPIGLILIYKFAKNWFWHLLGLLFVLSFMLNIGFVNSKPEATFYLMPTRGWEFLAGSLIIPFESKIQFLLRKSLASTALMFTGLTTLLVSAVIYQDNIPFPGSYALLPVIGTTFLILGGTHIHTTNPLHQLLTSKPFRYIGDISYPLYLVHWPIHVYAGKLLADQYTKNWHIVMFCLSFVLAAFVYHLFETPIRQSRFFKVSKNLLVTYFFGVIATVAIFAIVFSSEGLPKRFTTEVLQLASFSSDRNMDTQRCIYTDDKDLSKSDSYCKLGDLETESTWLIYGDSHAWAGHEAISQWLEKRDESGLFIFLDACIPLSKSKAGNIREQRCSYMNQEILDFAGTMPSLKNIFLVSIWRPGDDKRDQQEFNKNLISTLNYYKEIKRSVYIWEPLSTSPFSLPDKLARMHISDKKYEGWSYYESRSYHDFLYKVMDENTNLISGRFMSSKIYCSEDLCSPLLKNKPVFSDNNHIIWSSQSLWSEALSSEVNWNDNRVP